MVAPSNLLQAKKLPFSAAIQLISACVPCSIKTTVYAVTEEKCSMNEPISFDVIGIIIRKLIDTEYRALQELKKNKNI